MISPDTLCSDIHFSCYLNTISINENLMTLPRPVKFCPICSTELLGRLDKIFCSVHCKNIYHRKRKAQRLPFTDPIDKMLHRNWVILTEIHEEIGKNKMFIPLSRLLKAGFHTNYFTTRQVNSKGKEYFFIYNYGWMMFSEKEVMVTRMKNPK